MIQIIDKFCKHFMYEEALVYAEMLYNSSSSLKNLEVYARVLYLMNRQECVFHLIDKELVHVQLNESLLCLYGLSSINCNPDKALIAIKSFFTRNEGSEFIHIVFANLRRIYGDSPMSRRHFEKAVEINPLLIHSYKQATLMGSKINHLLFNNKDTESDITAPDSPIINDPGIVTRANSLSLSSNLSISQSNLKRTTKSLKRKASHDNTSHKVKRQRIDTNDQNLTAFINDDFKNLIKAFDFITMNHFKEAYDLLSDGDILNKNGAFASVLRIIAKHELNVPNSDVLFSISEHLENFEFSLQGIEHIIVILWIYQDVDRISDLSLKLKKLFPNTWYCYLCAACESALCHNINKSISLLDKATQMDQSGFAASVAGWILMTDDQHEAALSQFLMAKKRNHVDPRVLTGLGYVYLRIDNLPNALLHLQESERLKTNSETNKKLLAQVFRKLDKLTEAYDVLINALKIYPRDKGLLNEFIILCIKMNLITVKTCLILI